MQQRNHWFREKGVTFKKRFGKDCRWKIPCDGGKEQQSPELAIRTSVGSIRRYRQDKITLLRWQSTPIRVQVLI